MRTTRLSSPLASATLALVVAAIAMLSLVVAPPTSAQDGQACPEGFVPSSDGTGCVSEPEGAFNNNVTTSTSCLQGVLSEDRTQCLLPRLDAAPAPAAAGTGASTTVAGPQQAFTG